MFGVEGDDIYLFDGFSARQHFNNDRRQWTLAQIEQALQDVDLQDRGFMIAPGMRVPVSQPSDDTLNDLKSAGNTPVD